jgi:hypothetical protein
MDDFYFQDATKGVVDDWVKDLEDQPITTPQGFDNNDMRKNYGLGFDKKESKKQAGQGVNSSDAFVERMAKQKKKKESKIEVVEITHGIVEEEILSRASSTSFAGKKRKQLQEEEQKKQNSVQQSSVASIDVSSQTQPPSQGTAIVGEGEMRHDQQPPKRVKTRSKQKNIRRDKRAAEFKPSHLHVGSKEYTGRPLTKETKAILGLPSKTKPARR